MEIYFLFTVFLIPGLSLLFCIYMIRKRNMPSWIKTPIMLNLMTTIPAFMVFLIGIFSMDHPNNDIATDIFSVLFFLYPIMAVVTSVISYVWYSIRPTKWTLLPLGFMVAWYVGIFLSFVIAIWG